MEHAKKIVFICVTSQSVVNFRLSLIKNLQEKGYEIHVICFDDKYKETIEENNIIFHNVVGSNRGLNVVDNLRLKSKYYKIIKEIDPYIVFTFMLKPNVFGVPAAEKAGVKNIYSMVEGVGDVYINKGIKWKLLRRVVNLLYKKAFKYSKSVYFLNQDDEALFKKNKLVEEGQCVLIDGIGVDSDKFAYYPLEKKEKFVFLMVARLNKTKGVLEYCEASRRLIQNNPNVECWLIGQEGNIKLQDIKEYIDDGSIVYKGTTDNIYEFYKQCSVYVLPSYREGMPMSVLEAMSTGRGVITTNTEGGCRHIVNDGYNGFLVNVNDSCDLFDKMLQLSNNNELAVSFGYNSRKLVDEKYNKINVNKIVVSNILKKEKVLHVLSSKSFSGAENVAVTIIENNFDCFEFAYCSLVGDVGNVLKKRNIKFYGMNKINVKELKKTIKEYRPDIIHAHDIKASVISSFVGFGGKIISHLHKNDPKMKKLSIKSLLYLFASKRFDKVVGVSNSVLEEFKYKNKIKGKFLTLYNFVDKKNIIEKSKEIKVDKKYDLFFFGRLSIEKGCLDFIDICNLVNEKKRICAVMIGDGPMKEECLAKIDKLNLNEVIDLVGFQSNPFPYIVSSNIGIMPSAFEGFGLSAIESTVLGKPVLNSGVGGLSEIFENNMICKSVNDYVQKILNWEEVCLVDIEKYCNYDNWKKNIEYLYK